MPWPEMAHSCTAPDHSFADPGIRTANLAFGFGAKGFVFSICDFSFVQPMTRFAQAIGGLFSPSCIADPIADDLTRPGAQPDCKVTARTNDGSGAVVDSAVPACDDNGGTPPCWSLVAGRAAVHRAGAAAHPRYRGGRPPPRSRTTARCARRGSRSSAARKISVQIRRLATLTSHAEPPSDSDLGAFVGRCRVR